MGDFSGLGSWRELLVQSGEFGRSVSAGDLLGLTGLVVSFVITIVFMARFPVIRYSLFVGWGLRAMVACTHYYIWMLPGGLSDATAYEHGAWQLALGESTKLYSGFGLGSSFYPWLSSVIYSVTGRSPLMLQAVNIAMGMGVVVLSYAMARNLWGRAAGVRAAWISALFPTLILYSSHVLREMLVIFPLMAGFYCAVIFSRTEILSRGVMAFVFFVLASFSHAGLFVVPVAYLLILVGLAAKKERLPLLSGKIKLKSVYMFFLGLVVFASVLVFLEVNPSYFGTIFDMEKVISRLTREPLDAGAAYPGWVLSDNLIEVFLLFPPRIIYFLLSPFPWDISETSQLLGLVLLPFIFLILKSIWASRKEIIAREESAIVLFLLVAGVVAFSLSVDNFGTAIRHKTKFVPVLAVLCAHPLLRIKTGLFRR